MKKQFTLIALIILIYGCKKEQEDLTIISPKYEYQINKETQQNLGTLSFANIDSATKDTLIYLFDDQNNNSKLELRFNNEKIEARLAYNDTIYYSDVLSFNYRKENDRLYGKFSFKAFNNFKFVQVIKGKFENIKVNN